MTLEEMEAAGRQAGLIRSLKAELAKAQSTLAAVNQYGKAGQVWRPELRVKDAPPYSYGHGEVTVRVAIPFGVIQQSALDEVRRLRREIIQAGGTP